MSIRSKETYEKIKIRYNNILIKSEQNIRIVDFTSKIIHLNNGLILNQIEKRKFKTRLTLSPFLKSHFDEIYDKNNIIIRDKIIKRLISENATIKAKKIWNDLDTERKKERKIHMRKIRVLVDNANRFQPIPWNKGKTKQTDNRLKKISEDMMGMKNSNYGKITPEEVRAKQSRSIRATIKAGLFTPNIHNSRTHLESIFNDQKYRSSWEAIYASLNTEDLYEKIRVEYEYENKKRIYIVDFVNHEKKTLTEIKPDEHCNTTKNQEKFKAAEKWCKNNQYTFIILTQKYFIENYDNISFNELQIPNIKNKLRKIQYEANKQNKNNKA